MEKENDINVGTPLFKNTRKINTTMPIIKNTNAITLIALVITIIVLLILAGVTIATSIGDNGLINRAKDIKIQTEIASIKEEIQIDILDKQAQNEGNISYDSLEKILQKYGVLSEEEKIIDKTLITTKGNYSIKVLDIFNGITQKDIDKNPVIADKSGANKPIGKIMGKQYITWEWNDTTKKYNEKISTIEPDNWYDYENGKWANIKTMNNEIEAYWVWIPRYEYIVPTSETATRIEVKFIPVEQKQADIGYTIHPAFTNEGNGGFGDLAGIWVSKFEASSDKNGKVQVKPSVQSYKGMTTNSIYQLCRKITSGEEALEGSEVDSHMMKNTEWGAVAILSQSKYGIFNLQSNIGENGDSTYQIWNNPRSQMETGYAGDSKDATTNAIYEYDTINGTKASTTGTVYGIYDMVGGSWEYVAGCINGYEESGFGVALGNSKYVDLYTNSSNSYSNYDGAKIGDATKETKGWNGDYSKFVHSNNPVFLRGRLLWYGCRSRYFCISLSNR